MPNVLIRADGNKNIGMGHLKRAFLISEALSRNFKIKTKLVMKDFPESRRFALQRNMDAVIMPAAISDNEEITVLERLCKETKVSLLILDVLDKYKNNYYISSIKKFNCQLAAVIDESGYTAIDADLVINGNPNQLGMDYSKERGKYLIGPMNFLMDEAYGSLKVDEPNGTVKKILLTLGGSDHNNLLFGILDILEKMKPNFSISLITSEATGYLDYLKNYISKLSIPVEVLTDVETLLPFWSRCDLAITAGGNTLFERIASRLPGATLCQLERQMEIADKFESLGVNVNLGFGPRISVDNLSKKISEFINNKELQLRQYQKSAEILDGKGLERFSKEIEILLRSQK